MVASTRPDRHLARESGVLLHVTSLPGGRLGKPAYRFVDWLQRAGQSWWQILPLGPTDERGSPYRSSSAFACSPALLADRKAPVSAKEMERFVAAHPYWSGDWAQYAGPGALADQVRFEREWSALRRYAAARGVRLIGDLPFYIAPGSADHVSHPELFNDAVVAGVPPDDWTATGQLWGNPLYDWTAMRAQGFRWWTERFRRTFELVDVARVDHFRAFIAGWAVPRRNRTARSGTWLPAPGRELFRAITATLGPLPLIAENLGVITPPVERLRREIGAPGMHVIQFAFTDHMKNPQYAAQTARDTVVYTGTHDNPTTAQWWRHATSAERANVRAAAHAAHIEDADPVWAMIELALRSPANLAIIPAQDILGLGARARMNTPGTDRGNWRWRLHPRALNDALADRLRTATLEAGRGPTSTQPARRDSRARAVEPAVP